MADVFVSYASEDRETVRKLAGVLESYGYSVWWDRKIIAGQTYDQVIERELDMARAAVVLWSKNSVTSEWVKNEAAAAAEKGVLVPALIENVKLPLEFRRRQTVDLAGWDGDETHSGLTSLHEGIAVTISGTAAGKSIPVTPSPTPPSPSPALRYWMFASIAALVVIVGLVAYFKPWQGEKERTVETRVTTDVRPEADRTDSNRQPEERQPSTTLEERKPTTDYASLIRRLSQDQRRALEMMIGQDKSAGLRQIEKNLVNIDKVVKSFPRDNPEENANLFVSMGYALKDMHQASKGRLPSDMRQQYLFRARASFAQALRLDRRNAGAYNGMGNVLFLEGKFDEALKYHARALALAGGKDKYPAAEHDRQLVMKVRDGEIPFDF
ncbi:MAG: TIR domain-containing protein [Smithella sp.]